MKANPSWKATLSGHADSTGDASYNMGLSKRRAESVKKYLVGKGIAAERIATQAFGENNPVASNNTRDGRALNRRVEPSVSISLNQ